MAMAVMDLGSILKALWIIAIIVITILLTIIFTLEKIQESNNMNEKYSACISCAPVMQEYMEHTEPDIRVVITMRKGKLFKDGSKLAFDGYEGIFRTDSEKELGSTISGVVYFIETQLYAYKKEDVLNVSIPDKSIEVVATAKIEAIYNDALRVRR